MQFTIARDALLAALAPGAAVTTKNDKAAPILGFVRFDASTGEVAIMGTNLMITMTRSSPCEVAKKGSMCLPANELEKIVGLMPAGDVRLEQRENTWVEVTSLAPRKKVSVKLRGQTSADFPEVATVPATRAPPVSMKIADLRMVLDAVLYSACKDAHRPHLGVVHIEHEYEGSGLHAVSTDGHRLTHARADLAFPVTGAQGVNVPAHSLRRLLSALPEEGAVDVLLAPGYLVATSGPLRAVLKLGDQPFPAWRQIIPTSFEHTCTLARADVAVMLARAETLAAAKTGSTTFEFSARDGSGELAVSVDNPDQGAMRDSVSEGVALSGAGLKTCMNAVYIDEAIQHLPGDKITFSMRGKVDAVHITGAGYVADNGFAAIAIVMPMQS